RCHETAKRLSSPRSSLEPLRKSREDAAPMHFTQNRLSRRRFLQSTLATGAVALSGGFPAISRAADRPLVTHGVQSGDVSFDRAVVWPRTDRAGETIREH